MQFRRLYGCGGAAQADMLSYKRRGAHPIPPKGREPDTHPLFLGGCSAGYCGLKILILSSGG